MGFCHMLPGAEPGQPGPQGPNTRSHEGSGSEREFWSQAKLGLNLELASYQLAVTRTELLPFPQRLCFL